MAVKEQIKMQHLLLRSGFGIDTAQINQLQKNNLQDLYKQISEQSAPKPAFINVIEEQQQGTGNMYMDMKMAGADKKAFVRKSIGYIKKLNLVWLDEMVSSKAQLREKMSLFWHGHFATRTINASHQQLLLHTIRTNALGNFGDLLKAVSKSAAMLQFLNSQQNKKQSPNENFAREVMELFTLGRGNYTEQDVKEAARSFTGWGFNAEGGFVERDFVHDDGSKTVFGKKGNFKGDDILEMLLERKETAAFITRKIYHYFVNDIIDEEKVAFLAEGFYKSNYNLKKLLDELFTSSWFYDEKNIGAKIKSPVELLVGVRRILPVQLKDAEVLFLFQKILGQLLFYPPNVAGWPGGKNWIDSSTLMMRLRIPKLIDNAEPFSIQLKTDDDTQMGMNNSNTLSDQKKANINTVTANVDWKIFTDKFNDIPEKELPAMLEALLLQTKSNAINSSLFNDLKEQKSKEEYLRVLCIALMGTPEYQMC